MSKELTPLEALKNLTEYLTGDCRDCFEELTVIEIALKRLETLEEEKQSFDRQLEKKLKALEIIKEKRVDVSAMKHSIDVYDYNSGIENENDFENRLLTKKEYKLLKEVLL